RLLPQFAAFTRNDSMVNNTDRTFGFLCLRFVIAGALSVLVAWTSRHYYEEPFLRLKDRLSKGSVKAVAPVRATQPSYEQPAA
ncbi:MAG TPA: hypothetical protein VHQ86_00945, partial [Candidatus Saccharimonadia bacterium]|nr:hypothetical protein [Candidatus Saccharimonadia bacterium]